MRNFFEGVKAKKHPPLEENAENAREEVRNFFEGVTAKKHPPPEEKVDPVKAKRTLVAPDKTTQVSAERKL